MAVRGVVESSTANQNPLVDRETSDSEASNSDEQPVNSFYTKIVFEYKHTFLLFLHLNNHFVGYAFFPF